MAINITMNTLAPNKRCYRRSLVLSVYAMTRVVFFCDGDGAGADSLLDK